MSAKAVGWAFALQVHRSIRGIPLSPPQQLALLAIADRFNGEAAWPGQSDIVARTGLSERTLRNALNELERIGVIRREPRLNDKKRLIGTMYYLPWYSDDWARERAGYDFDAASGRFDPDRAAENLHEMGGRFDGMFGESRPAPDADLVWANP